MLIGAIRHIGICLVCVFGITHGDALAQPRMTLMYNERPPYLIAQPDGSAIGLTGSPAAQAFKAAGIPVTWLKISTKRQIQALIENAGQSCAIGWFYKPEREQFAKFSKPIFRDQAFVAIAAASNSNLQGGNLENILKQGQHSLLLKEGFSYGAIDAMLAKHRPSSVTVNVEVVEMLQMIQARRADMMFAALEEAEYLVKNAGFKAENFKILQFSDLPHGNTRHLMCSKQVPDEMLERINAAINFKP